MLVAYALTYCGFTLLAISMNKHFRQIVPLRQNLSPTQEKWLRMAGWLLITLGLVSAGNQFGWANSLVALTGLATVSIFFLALLLNFNPRLIPASLLALILLTVASL